MATDFQRIKSQNPLEMTNSAKIIGLSDILLHMSAFCEWVENICLVNSFPLHCLEAG